MMCHRHISFATYMPCSMEENDSSGKGKMQKSANWQLLTVDEVMSSMTLTLVCLVTRKWVLAVIRSGHDKETFSTFLGTMVGYLEILSLSC